jgi:hypothetical protein
MSSAGAHDGTMPGVLPNIILSPISEITSVSVPKLLESYESVVIH